MEESHLGGLDSLENDIGAFTVSQSMLLQQLSMVNNSVSFNQVVDSDQVTDLETQVQSTITQCYGIRSKFDIVKNELETKSIDTQNLI